MTEDHEFDVQDDAEMDEIHHFDFQRAVGLMMIAEKVATVAPKCTSLLGIAQAELEQMNQQAKDIARRRADRAREADERKAAAEAEKAKAEAETETTEDSGPRAIPSERRL